MRYEIRDRDLLELRAFYTDLFLVFHWEELIECSMLHLSALIPNDCLCWNEWNPGFDAPKRIEVNAPYRDSIHSLLPALEETLEHHPVLKQFGWDGLSKHPHRISDYQSQSLFKENPLFKEVYSQLDAYYQIVYQFASTSSAELILTVNRRLQDFDERERQLVKLAGHMIAPFAQSIHQREDAMSKADAIAKLVEESYGLINITRLSPGEIFLIKELASGRNVSSVARSKKVRRDTVSRQLSIAREKLGLTSNKELISALRSEM